ncbi:MAG: manganese efflux pump [Clostridia bacterium]|nr:manganese efflux pump [Clostridia bacterium]
MNLIGIILIAIGLAMDAFAVAVCKGLSIPKLEVKNAIKVGAYFGAFQGMMPIIGYFLGISFEKTVSRVDHWIAFFLLGFIGANMIKEAFCKCENDTNDKLDVKTMITLAVATSIDALTVGVTFAFLQVNIWIAALMIGIITFVLSMVGVKIGNKFGNKYGKKAELFGGFILIIMGTKILLEHLSII